MKNFLLITRNVDTTPLLLAIARRPEMWQEDTYMRDYPQGPFGDVETVFLRFPTKSVKQTQAEVDEHLATHDQHESIDYPNYKLLPEARPLVMNLMHYVGGERLGRVMINKLRAGGRIFPHADTPSHADYYSRFHLVLKSSPGVLFRCDDERAYFEPGSVFWFNNKLEHEVINDSDDDRIHMVIDVRTSR